MCGFCQSTKVAVCPVCETPPKFGTLRSADVKPASKPLPSILTSRVYPAAVKIAPRVAPVKAPAAIPCSTTGKPTGLAQFYTLSDRLRPLCAPCFEAATKPAPKPAAVAHSPSKAPVPAPLAVDPGEASFHATKRALLDAISEHADLIEASGFTAGRKISDLRRLMLWAEGCTYQPAPVQTASGELRPLDWADLARKVAAGELSEADATRIGQSWINGTLPAPAPRATPAAPPLFPMLPVKGALLS